MKKYLALALSALVAFAACTDPNENKTEDEVTLDGQWTAPRSSEQPSDIAFTIVFKGNKLDFYIISWGQHYTGTYTHANDAIKFNISSAKHALSNVSYDKDNNMITWEWMIGNLDAKTLELSPGYDWYDYTGEDYENDKQILTEFKFKLNGNKAESNLFGIDDLVFTKSE